MASAASFSRSFAGWLSGRSRTQKARLNTVAAVIDYAARLAVGFVLNPMLVAGLGSHGFGLWQVLRRLVGYAQPAGGRPTQALKWTIAKEQASTDYHAKRQHVGSTLALWLVFLPVLTAAGVLVTWLAPRWLDVPVELVSAARWATGLLVANLIMMTLVEIPRVVLAGENMAYRRMGLSAGLVLLGGAMTALALHLELGLVGVAACPVIVSLLTGILFVRVARRYVPWFGVARPTAKAMRAFFGLSGWFVVWRVVIQAMKASDLVLLGAFVSLETVTTYTLTKYVPETLVVGVVMVIAGALPGIGGILGAGQVERARSLRAEVMSVAWLISTVAGTTMVLWNEAFVGLWVGAEHFAGALPTLLIVLMMVQFAAIRLDANIIDLTLDLRSKVIVGAFSAVLSVGLAILLLVHFELGIAGLCGGFIAGRALLSVAYPWMVGRVLRVSVREQMASLGRPGALSVVLFALAFQLGPELQPDGWLELVPAVAASGLLTLALAFYGGLSGAQRQRIVARLSA